MGMTARWWLPVKSRQHCCLAIISFLVFVPAVWTLQQAQQQAQRQRQRQQQQSCSICGDLGPSQVPFPEKELPPDLNLPVSSCFDMETTALVVDLDSQLCRWIQSVGTYCGCQPAPRACSLCWDGSPATNKSKVLSNYHASDFLDGFGSGVALNCETLEAFLHGTLEMDTDQCLATQIDAGEQCGCPAIVRNDTTTTTNQTEAGTSNSTGVNNTEPDPTPSTPTSNRLPCRLCSSGEAPPFPDRMVDVGRDTERSCSDWDLFSSTFAEDSDDCVLIRSVSRICECPPQPDECRLCPLGESVPKPDQSLNWLDKSNLSTETSSLHSRLGSKHLTCELMESVVASNHRVVQQVMSVDEGLVCTAAQMKSWICGCRPDWRPIALTWSYRLSGLLSFAVSKKGVRRACDSFFHHLVLLFFMSLGLHAHHCNYPPPKKQTLYVLPPTHAWHLDV